MKLLKLILSVGYKIFEKSDLDMLRIAANLALNHHEKYDGSGYPNGLKEEALDYIRNQKGKHFDPELVDIFISNIEGILDID